MSTILTVALNPAIDLSSEAQAVHHTRKIRTVDERHDPGGGGINVARVIAALGGEAEVLFAAGGETGAMLDRLLKQEGIRRRKVPITGLTRISYTVKERSTGLEYRFVPKGPSVQADELQPCLDEVAAHKGDYVIASGSLPAGAPADTYARMADLTAARGARFVLDTSGDGLRETFERARVFLAKPSLGELEQFVGEKLDKNGAARAAADLVNRGTSELVAVTMGSEGAILASAAGVLRAPAIHVSVRSAVGAGDSFVAAMVSALAQGKSAEDAFQLGAAAGAAAVMTPGTELCRTEDVKRLYQQSVRLEPIRPPTSVG